MTRVETMEGSAEYDGQTFLVGEHVYLRMVEPEDTELAVALRPSIFPWSPERAKKWIEEEIEPQSEWVYVVRRKADDVIVGSVLVSGGGRSVREIDPHLRPLLGDQGEVWLAEGLTVLLRYLIDECHISSVRCRLPADREVLITALEQARARQTVRFREYYAIGGQRVDQVVLEALDPVMVEKLGDPREQVLPQFGTGEPRPVIAPVELDGDPPKNAVVVGPRVYLRPFQKGDGKIFSSLLRTETERWTSDGRPQASATVLDKWMLGLQKEEPPGWLRFVICLRENDEAIGMLGVESLDLLNGNGDSESEINVVKYRGNGYGSEAKHLLFHYAFNILGLHALQSYVIFPNTRSAAALRKQGYKETGRLHWFYPMESVVTFDLLADEWRTMPRVTLNEMIEEGSAA